MVSVSKAIDLRGKDIYPIDSLSIPEHYCESLNGVLIPEGLIGSRIEKIASDISKNYKDISEPIIAICMLNGALKFYTDLMYNANMSVHFEIETLRTSSYEGTESTGKINFRQFDWEKLRGRKVLIVEDILDTGRTLNATIDYMKMFNPASLEIACLLDKPERRLEGMNVNVDYLGFIIPDAFVVGYGLDYNGRFRDFHHIGIYRTSE